MSCLNSAKREILGGKPARGWNSTLKSSSSASLSRRTSGTGETGGTEGLGGAPGRRGASLDDDGAPLCEDDFVVRVDLPVWEDPPVREDFLTSAAARQQPVCDLINPYVDELTSRVGGRKGHYNSLVRAH